MRTFAALMILQENKKSLNHWNELHMEDRPLIQIRTSLLQILIARFRKSRYEGHVKGTYPSIILFASQEFTAKNGEIMFFGQH
jgi:hypothetical protein